MSDVLVSVSQPPNRAVSTPGSADHRDAERNNDQVLLDQLSKMWQDHHKRGLELRHQTGVKLNERFGPPTARQAYGEANLQRYSETLGVAESDLSRMRWFAHLFKSVEDFRAAHPAETTWTKVKELLARLRHPQAVRAADAPDDEKKSAAERPVAKVIGAVRAVQEQLKGVGKLPPGSDDWKALSEAVDGMLKTVGECLGQRFHPLTIAEPGRYSLAAVKYRNAVRSEVEVQRPDRSTRTTAVTVVREGDGQADSL